ncbi:uncharacterized protein LOC132210412, partial [Stegostoma tigrinum]|uniref:uncharacterized protein LOC132210412 n=1 Tax=Stegostoma tigrinum TaxID=3053191 RepID=UPI00286FBFC6
VTTSQTTASDTTSQTTASDTTSQTTASDTTSQTTASVTTSQNTASNTTSQTTNQSIIYINLLTITPHFPTRFVRINLIRVASREISISWDASNAFTLTVYEVILSSAIRQELPFTTNKKKAVFRNLLPDVEYNILVLVKSCSQQQSIQRRIRTRAKVLNARTRIRNRAFVPQLLDRTSRIYKQFVNNFIQDLLRRVTLRFLSLYNRNLLRIVIIRLTPGSVTVDFNIALSLNENVTLRETAEIFAKSLNTSTEFDIDITNTNIAERDSCQPEFNDCSDNGTCTRQNSTYTCQCNTGFNDTSPNVPGRICEDIDECQTGKDTCSALATCTNTPGNFTCNCLAGTIDTDPANPGAQCKDIDECQNGNNTCSDLAVCRNIPGNFSCSCFQGIIDTNLANPGTQCIDPNICFINNGNICTLSDCMVSTVSNCNNKIAFRMQVILRSRVFSNDLRNPVSEAYRNLSNSFMNTVVPRTQVNLNDRSFNIFIVGFQNGSIVINFLAVLNDTSTVNRSRLLTAVGAAVKALDNNSLITITGTTQLTTEAPVQPQTAPTLQSKPGTENPGWKAAVIVLGSILGVALLTILAAVLTLLYTKKKSRSYSVETSDIVRQINYSNL